MISGLENKKERKLEFTKENPNNKIWEVTEYEIDDKGDIDIIKGPLYFSFDKKKIFNYWRDYPNKLTKEEKEIFDKEFPFWANFRKGNRIDEKNNCPYCDEKLAEIVYGMPTSEAFEAEERGEIKLGGCMVLIDAPQPEYYCKSCNKEFYKDLTYAGNCEDYSEFM